MPDMRQIILQCKHCNNKTAHNIMGICGDLISKEEDSVHVYTLIGTVWLLLQCVTCSKPMLTEGYTQFRSSNPEPSYALFYSDYGTILTDKDTVQRINYPINASVTQPSSDTPSDVAEDYIEARSIFESSPRSSAALLRLAIQKLCKHLGQSGKNINNDISALVKKGLPIEIQQALDIVRVVGNNAVHPGEIDLRDNSEIALSLFNLVNIIVEVMITRPRTIEKLYNDLPENIRQAILNRDK